MNYRIKFFLILLAPIAMFAQKNFEEGFIVTLDLDAIIDLVKDRKEEALPKLYDKVYFKKGHLKRKYKPEQILFYKKDDHLNERMWFQDHGIPFMGFYLSKSNLGKKYFSKLFEGGIYLISN